MRNASEFAVLGAVFLSLTGLGACAEVNLYQPSVDGKIVLVVPERPAPLEQFAISELAKHIRQVAGAAPEMGEGKGAAAENLVVIGRTGNNATLKQLAERGFIQAPVEEQGYCLRTDANTGANMGAGGESWLAVLCGADPHGVLYAVRDFCHYYFYKDNSGVVLRRAHDQLAPRLKLRGLSESGCNLFSAKNDQVGFMHVPKLNYHAQDVVFDKKYYVDWLSEWKLNFVSLLWCNYAAYDEARRDFTAYAHSRGIKVLGFFVPYRPSHESPPRSVSSVDPMSEHGDCPRDPEIRKWYFDRLVELVTRAPKIDMIQIESPYHDGTYCQCSTCQGRKNPYPEDKMLEEMADVVRSHRPEIPIVRGMKQAVPDEAAARRLAAQLKKLEAPQDWHMNTFRDREHRRRWHDLGPKFATYLRLYRSALRGKTVPAEIDFLYNDFRMSAERDIVAHQFCYRFYGGKYGSFPVEKDEEIRGQHLTRKGPLSLALTAEAAFDPFVEGKERLRKIERIRALTIPDYPPGRPFPAKELRAALRDGM
jgi:hypothetical protein